LLSADDALATLKLSPDYRCPQIGGRPPHHACAPHTTEVAESTPEPQTTEVAKRVEFVIEQITLVPVNLKSRPVFFTVTLPFEFLDAVWESATPVARSVFAKGGSTFRYPLRR